MITIASYYNAGKRVVKKAKEVLLKGGSLLDAVEEGIKVIEEDLSIDSVGLGGFPNIFGEVELDAAIMDGETLKCGSVGAVKYIKHPITLARKVMELTPHVMIVSHGASHLASIVNMKEDIVINVRRFKQFIETVEKYEKFLLEGKNIPLHLRRILELSSKQMKIHDTIGVIVYKNGKLAAGVSTSGLPLKFPGRISDSAIIGAGIYADNNIGAAVCTGFGEIAIRLCAAKSVLDLMRFGYKPEEALKEVLERVNEISNREGENYHLGIIVVDREGNVHAAANFNFYYTFWRDDINEIKYEKAELVK